MNVPGDRSPGGSEEEDVDANKSNSSFLCSFVMNDNVAQGILAGGGSSQNSNEELRNSHANSSQKQNWASSPLINSIETGDSRADINTASNQTDNKLILKPRVLEELSTVIEDKVDTGQLLESLEETSSKKTFSKVTLETFEITGASNAHLEFMVCADLGKFLKQSRVIAGKTSEFGQTPDGTFVVVSLD